MKKLIVVIILLIATALVAPKFIGGIVEAEYKSAVDKIAENPAIKVNDFTFERGWFGGKVTTDMTVLLHDDEVGDIKIIVEDNLSFGPAIFTDSGIKFALSYSQANINFNELLLDDEIADFIKDKIHFTGLLTFSKDIVSTIVIDEVSKEVDGNKVVSSKAVGEFVLENKTRIYGDFNWAGLTATTSDESFTIGEIKFSLDQTLIAGDYYQGNAISTGDFDFVIASIKANDNVGNSVFSLDNLLINAMSSVTNDLMQIKMNYSADKLVSAGQQLEKANLAVVFNGLNISVMQDVNTLMTELSVDGEEMFSPENMEKLSALTAKLLADDPIIEITDFGVETPEGKIESAMQISVDKNLFDTANIMSIMAAVKANANGNAPMSFFAKLGLAPMVDMYVQQGFIIQTEDELSFKINFAQGQLNVNGNVIPL